MRKQKGKKAGGAKRKDDAQESKDGAAESSLADPSEADQAQEKSEEPAAVDDETKQEPFPDIKEDDKFVEEKQADGGSETPSKQRHGRQPSLSLQSKMRSSSFRRTSMSQTPISPGANGSKSPEIPLLSPDGDSVNSIYRKQAARLDDSEKENKRLAKEATDVEKKWRQTEEELEELREASGEVAELKSRLQRAEAQAEELNKVV